MKKSKILLLSLLIVFIAIQFVPTSHNQSNEVLVTDFAKIFDVPDDVQALLKNSCYDCHSNNTTYPWYDKIQPVSWFLEHHVKEAKAELNFSDFGSYSVKKQKHKLEEIIEEIKEGEMPLTSYTLMHGDARLSLADKGLLEKWIANLRKGL